MPRALIIGAGPAGSLAAILLRKRNWHVTLVEQHRFPRDKVCGECLSPLGFDVLSGIELANDFLALGPVRMDRTIFHTRFDEACDMILPRPMWGISRGLFDNFLLNHARRFGAQILQPARCESVRPGRASIHDLQTNRVDTINADCIIVADGKCGLTPHRPAPTTDLGIKAHWTHVDGPRDAVELFGLDGQYGGLAPVEGGRWNSAFSIPADRVRAHGGDLDRVLRELFAQNQSLARRLRHAHQAGPILASPLPRFDIINRYPPGIVPIGNAAAAIEPIGGEGMGLALRSAELASAWIDYRHKTRLPFDSADLARHFRKLWRGKPTAYRAAALAMSRNSTAAACVDFLSSGFGQQTFSRVLEFLIRQNPRSAQAR